MCGISGYFAFAGPVEDPSALQRMNRAVAHRGPDGEGLFLLQRATGQARAFCGTRTPMTPPELGPCASDFRFAHDVALGHRRFAILDLSPGGHQPLVGDGGAMALCFNGEIYNYVELRAELEKSGAIFRTRGDAEVLLQAYRHWGEACFERLAGFWALALWDQKHGLLLARDRLGKAPLYHTCYGGRRWWSSEIKGLLAAAGRRAFAVRPQAAAWFARAGLRDFGGETFFQGIRTFPAASFAWVREDGDFALRRFWRPPAARLRPSEISAAEAAVELRQRLFAAVSLRLRADAPVGLELSGGLDSSTLAAFAARAAEPSAPPFAAFTVGFPDTAWNEAPFARQVLACWPGRFTPRELVPDAHAVLRGLAAFHTHMDEPIHSPNMVINQEIWRRMAAEGIRVSLNGAGGDEVFAGYGSEYFGPFVRGLIERGRFATAAREFVRCSERPPHSAAAWLRLAWMLLPEGFRRGVRPPFPAQEIDPLRWPRGAWPEASPEFAQRLLDHLGDYKMNYWLRSGNTSCMGVPLEVRLPLLDHRVVEWACRLPPEYLIRDGWLKWILRRAVEPWLPPEVTWRRVKMGFPFPLAAWLRTVKPALMALGRGDAPDFLDRGRLFRHYDFLAHRYPAYLWRCVSVLLWWKVAVNGETPVLDAAT